MSEQALDTLYEEYARKVVFARLADGRPVVRGSGPHGALAVVGEAPGRDEERIGRPFVGRSGKYLQRMLADAEIPWDFCYVMNVVPWRPPNNRTPYPFEVQASVQRVAAELDVVAPVVVVAAGAVAWEGLGGKAACPAEEALFRWHDLNGRRVLAIPHPSRILRMPPSASAEWRQQTVDALALALRVAEA
jgi:uracil-DNA glycosylase family 4